MWVGSVSEACLRRYGWCDEAGARMLQARRVGRREDGWRLRQSDGC